MNLLALMMGEQFHKCKEKGQGLMKRFRHFFSLLA